MKAALISLGSISSRWTAEAMRERFETVDELELGKMEINLGAKKEARLLYDGKGMQSYDCVYAKGSYRYAALLRAITTFLEDSTYMPIDDNAYTLVHNKLLTHLVLQRSEIPMPITYMTTTASAAKKLLEKVNYPIVMKFPEGTQGKGVMFAESYSSAVSLFDALQTLRQPFIIQEYIETGGTDIRAIVVGEKVVAAMQRKAVRGEKRANIHAGALGESLELDTFSKKLAIKAAKALSTEICGVDMLMGPKGPTVIELNISPGLQGIKKVTGIDVAKHIAKHLYKRTCEHKDKDIKDQKTRMMDDLGLGEAKDILTNIDLRGNRILLPGFVTDLVRFSEDDEVVVRAEKGRILIEKV